MSESARDEERSATAAGLAAIALWSALAALTAAVGPIPPFELAALTFAIGTCASALAAKLAGHTLMPLLQTPPLAILLGVGGLLGYHVCYFYALQNAPAVEANLVNYLWPLLIVVFSGLLPTRHGGRSLKLHHLIGAAMGLAGTTVVTFASGAPLTGAGSTSGYLAALAAAVIWAVYSVASRLFAHIPSSSVILACAVTSAGAFLLHLQFETTVWPASMATMAVLLVMGAGPLGLAFALWDRGMKKGDVLLLGVLSYATPLASTAWLALSGLGQSGPIAWLGALLVTLGAFIAASDTLSRNKKRAP